MATLVCFSLFGRSVEEYNLNFKTEADNEKLRKDGRWVRNYIEVVHGQPRVPQNRQAWDSFATGRQRLDEDHEDNIDDDY